MENSNNTPRPEERKVESADRKSERPGESDVQRSTSQRLDNVGKSLEKRGSSIVGDVLGTIRDGAAILKDGADITIEKEGDDAVIKARRKGDKRPAEGPASEKNEKKPNEIGEAQKDRGPEAIQRRNEHAALLHVYKAFFDIDPPEKLIDLENEAIAKKIVEMLSVNDAGNRYGIYLSGGDLYERDTTYLGTDEVMCKDCVTTLMKSPHLVMDKIDSLRRTNENYRGPEDSRAIEAENRVRQELSLFNRERELTPAEVRYFSALTADERSRISLSDNGVYTIYSSGKSNVLVKLAGNEWVWDWGPKPAQWRPLSEVDSPKTRDPRMTLSLIGPVTPMPEQVKNILKKLQKR